MVCEGSLVKTAKNMNTNPYGVQAPFREGDKLKNIFSFPFLSVYPWQYIPYTNKLKQMLKSLAHVAPFMIDEIKIFLMDSSSFDFF